MWRNIHDSALPKIRMKGSCLCFHSFDKIFMLLHNISAALKVLNNKL